MTTTKGCNRLVWVAFPLPSRGLKDEETQGGEGHSPSISHDYFARVWFFTFLLSTRTKDVTKTFDTLSVLRPPKFILDLRDQKHEY